MINLASLKAKIKEGIEIIRAARSTNYCTCGWCVCSLCITIFNEKNHAHLKTCEYASIKKDNSVPQDTCFLELDKVYS